MILLKDNPERPCAMVQSPTPPISSDLITNASGRGKVSLAEFERNIIRERTMAGLAARPLPDFFGVICKQ